MSRPDVEPRRVRIDLAYDGTDFDGWQVQPGRRTVQGTVSDVISRIQGGKAAHVRGAGRTDAGVHARAQVADVEVTTALDDGSLHYSLCGMLPGDLRPRVVRTVAADFHARRAALQRTYRYQLDRSAYGNPFLQRYALHYPGRLDRGLLEEGLSRLPGERDWSGFAGAASVSKSHVRQLYTARVEDGPESIWITFAASGYLNYMVRNLVGTLLEIARGRFEVGRLTEILDSGNRSLAGPTAPARGLHLWQVDYPESEPLG